MNKQRRNRIAEALELISQARDILEEVKDEEQESYENLPESLQYGERERQTVTVKEFIGTLESSDRLRIIEDGAEVYVGYLAAFKPFADHEISEEYRKYSGYEVKKFRAVPEITHRRWKELGLMKPLEPDQTAQYKFSDLQMSLYYTIYTQERKGQEV